MNNINEFTQLYRRTIDEVAGATSPHRIKLDRVWPKELRVLTHVTIEDETNAYTKCRIGIDAAGRTHYLDELISPAAGELAVSKADILLGENDVFFAELTGATPGDKLTMTCIGWTRTL